MNVFKLALRPETALPVQALALASAVCVNMAVTRACWTGRGEYYLSLVWNLFLAWLPLAFALLACEEYRKYGMKRHWCFPVWVILWFLFFPNAAYICTDLVHMTGRFLDQFWVDITLVLSCAFTGLVLGFLCLYLMQMLVVRQFGSVAAGWLFVLAMSFLCSFGIYLGRFWRINSWYVLSKPALVAHGVSRWAANPFDSVASYGFVPLFAIFFFICYVMLYALSHLQPPQLQKAAPASALPQAAAASTAQPPASSPKA